LPEETKCEQRIASLSFSFTHKKKANEMKDLVVDGNISLTSGMKAEDSKA
jgi:hypothetical protein